MMNLNSQEAALAVFNAISAISCLYLFYKFLTLSYRGTWLKMIIILVACDLIASLSKLWVYLDDSVIQVMTYFYDIAIRFSVFWAFVIAYMLYRVLGSGGFKKPAVYMFTTFAIVIVLSIALTFGHNAVAETGSEVGRILLGEAPLGLSMILSIVFFFKAWGLYKEQYQYQFKYFTKIIKTLFWFSFVRIPAFGPGLLIFYDTFYDLTDMSSPITVVFILGIPLALAGFMDCLVYISQKDVIEETSSNAYIFDLEPDLVEAEAEI